jgi:LuxR family maltose regulon positive regulatory protein
MSLDNTREWFRYHQLFADFLREELKRRYPDVVTHLHRRAARWYLAHDLPEQASAHAVGGDDVEFVIQIGKNYVSARILRGEFRLLERWVDSLPKRWCADYTLLGLARAATLVFAGEFEACAHLLDALEQRLTPAESEDSRWQLGWVTSVRCSIACIQNDVTQAEIYAAQALRDLPEEDLAIRADTYQALGDVYRGHGRWEDAKACYLKVLDLVHDPVFRIRSAHVFGALADLDLRQGRLRDAAAQWKKALAATQDRENWGSLPLPLISWVYIRMGEILYEWNMLEEASDHLSQGLERAELSGDAQTMLASHLIAGRLKLTAGDLTATGERLERARPLIEHAPLQDWLGRFERLQLEWWLAQGRVRLAIEWANGMFEGGEHAGRPASEETRLTIARALIANGDEPSLERTLTRLKSLLQAAQIEGRRGVQIEALALQALARWRRGDHADAMTALEHALRLAEPEGYVRLFADLGLPMARLLQEARSLAVMPEYVAQLLTAFEGNRLLSAQATTSLPEPLSQREREVLKLIAAGLTNREIAKVLVVSPETVKKHTGAIYSKLGVSNRTEAANKARELGLLD